MSNRRYPEDLEVTVEDFKSSGWKEAVSEADDYIDYWSELSSVAKVAMVADDKEKGKVLWLLADACSMMLRPDSNAEVFSALRSGGGGRSAMPEDFTDDDLRFFEESLAEADDYKVKARLADLLWHTGKPRKPEHALAAIDAYMCFPLGRGSLHPDGHDAWCRAIKLAKLLRDGAGIRLRKIRAIIFFKVMSAMHQNDFYTLQLASLLLEAGVDEESADKVIVKLTQIADGEKLAQNWSVCRGYYEGIRDWHVYFQSKEAVYLISVEVAETWVSEAEVRSHDSHMVARHHFEKALHEFRGIPRAMRAKLNIEARLEYVRSKMKDEGQLSLGDMQAFGFEMALHEPQQQSREHVSGKQMPDVLRAFANMIPHPKEKDMRNAAEEGIGRHPLAMLFESSHIAHDGRIQAKSPGIDITDKESDDTRQRIWATMLQDYCQRIGYLVPGIVYPALATMIREHRISENTLLSMCCHSTVIPPGRHDLWAKGLYYGFEDDFAGAIHLLVPQIEHMVRWKMKNAGLTTTIINSDYIEIEIGLTNLWKQEGIETIIDSDLVFELKALLTDPLGFNLRHEIAHGLIYSGKACSECAVFTWYVCLMLVVNSIPWNEPESAGESGEEGGDIEGNQE